MRSLSVFFVCFLLGISSAYAHKVIFAVYDEGDSVEGEVGFSNGDMAPDAMVEYFDSNNQKLGDVKSDQDGLFKIPLKGTGPFLFKANLGAGHVAEYLLEREGAAAASAVQNNVTTGQNLAATGDLEKLVSRSVTAQIKPLRKELAAYKEQNDLQKILGGLGYIFGLAGLGFYFAARQKLKGTPE